MNAGTGMRLLLRLVVVAGLGIDAYVHLHLAKTYSGVKASISMGTLFRIEAILAIVAALLVLALRNRLGDLLGFLVAGGGAVLVLVYRYWDIGKIGPFPDMYEPIWYTEKTVSLIGEAVAAVAALILLVTAGRTREPDRALA